MPPSTSYGSAFYESVQEGSLRSARVIIPLVLDLVGPISSVVDVGCGTGCWLKVFAELGTRDYLGLDGEYISRDSLLIPSDRFVAVDLTVPLLLDRRFELAVCLEVAEHLPLEVAELLVTGLTSVSDLVLFSAAIPYQGGLEHINEQWPSYWADRFAQQKFLALDPFRMEIWDDQRVEPWFAQNIFRYVASERIEKDQRLLREHRRTDGRVTSLVHPRCYVPKAKIARRASELSRSTLGTIALRMAHTLRLLRRG